MMLEMLPFDPDIAQKARELILESNHKLRDKDVDAKLIYQIQSYLNNLITLHALRNQSLEDSVSGLS
ncbi:hypothetical protein [Vibrio quintilis]|uniref:Uncharacterized protein n=1 Tax=Vibrio quintilis TaxID=1117707 RepID=A0A1M7YU77_9VIBR|nr:hypothetical protein [Vibrio quintilis]SHO56046.1 hypothetical protein VQ7734_01809 [Vibrio quintilis]